MPRKIVLALFLCTTGLSFNQQTFAGEVYVKDSLRVAVRNQPDNFAPPVAVVSTGMKLESLEQDGEFVRIRTQAGVEGWVKSTYLVESPPAMIRLKQIETEFETIKSSLKEQETQLQATELNNKNLNTELEQLKKAMDHSVDGRRIGHSRLDVSASAASEHALPDARDVAPKSIPGTLVTPARFPSSDHFSASS